MLTNDCSSIYTCDRKLQVYFIQYLNHRYVRHRFSQSSLNLSEIVKAGEVTEASTTSGSKEKLKDSCTSSNFLCNDCIKGHGAYSCLFLESNWYILVLFLMTDSSIELNNCTHIYSMLIKMNCILKFLDYGTSLYSSVWDQSLLGLCFSSARIAYVVEVWGLKLRQFTFSVHLYMNCDVYHWKTMQDWKGVHLNDLLSYFNLKYEEVL